MTGAIVSRFAAVFQFYPLFDQRSIVEKAILSALRDEERGLWENATCGWTTKRCIRFRHCATETEPKRAQRAGTWVADHRRTKRRNLHHAGNRLRKSSQKKVVKCDEHCFYDMLSAFCKSLRGGDSNAALHGLRRLIYAGRGPAHYCAAADRPREPRTLALRTRRRWCRPSRRRRRWSLSVAGKRGFSLTQAIIFSASRPNQQRRRGSWRGGGGCGDKLRRPGAGLS